MSIRSPFEIMHESASQVLSRHGIGYRVSNKSGVAWFNMAECPLCHHKDYQCGISESYGSDGQLYHGVKCFHIADNGLGTDTPEYEDFLFQLGELSTEGVSKVKNYVPRQKTRFLLAPGSDNATMGVRSLESFGLLNPDFHAKLRKRLRENENAMAYLTGEKRGLTVDTINYFGLGLQEPYISQKTNEEKADALVYPMRSGRDGKLYRKYGYYNIPGVTVNPTDKNAWMSGNIRTYYATAVGERKIIFVCEGAKDVWRNWQGIQGTTLAEQLLSVSSTHGSAFPDEWRQVEFWAPWEKIYFGHDNDEAGEAMISRLVQFVGRDIYRVEVPKYFGKDWTDFWQAGGDVNEFTELLEQAPAYSLPIQTEDELESGLGYGRVAYKPININGAFHNGHLYCTVETLHRGVEVKKNSNGTSEVVDVERLETVVVRSDRTVHSTVVVPAPQGTPDKFRVRRLTDGTLIDREPTPNKYGTWSWPSIKAYLDGKSKTRPLAEILAEVEKHFRSSVWLPYDEDYAILTLVVPVTYAQAIFNSVPLLFLNGPKGSGKSQTGRAMARICANAYICGQSSAASIARFIDASCGFVVLDDLEVIGNKGGEFTELVQALKLSYNKDTAIKLWTDVKTMKTEMLNFYGVKMINNTQGADRILSSRMLRIQTREIPEKLKQEFADLLPTESHKLHELRDELHTWTFDSVGSLDESYRKLYPKGSDRSDEITAPLKVMAELAGNDSLRSRLGLALTKQEQRAFDPDDPEEVLREAIKVLIGQGYELFSITHLVLEMRNLITHNYGKSTHYEIPEWARPEWVGRIIRTLDLIDPDTSKHKRERVWGANLRFYPFRPGYADEIRIEFAAKGVQLPLEPTDPTSFCQTCDSCPYSTLGCEILPRRENGRRKPLDPYSNVIGR